MAIQDFRLKAKKRKWRTKRLTETDIKTLPNGTYRDVGAPNLFFRRRGNSRTWISRYTFNGKQKPMSLGSVGQGIDLEMARAKAREAIRLIGEGKDPAEKKNNEQAELEIAAGLATTMKQATHYYMNVHVSGLTSDESKKDATRYCKLIIETVGDVPVRLIDSNMILRRFNLVERYYASGKVPTGEKLRFHLQYIFSLFMETCKLPRNPAGWEAMKRHIGKFVKKYKEEEIESQPGVHLKDMGRFLYELQRYQVHKRHGRPNAALWLELTYLTGSRPGEGRKATFGEIVNDDWIVPKHHLKKRRKSRTQPITELMHAVFDEMRQRYRDTHGGCEPSSDDLIFPKEDGGLYSVSASNDVIRALKWDYRITPYGARNTIRNWFQENEKDTLLLVVQFDHRPPESGAMKFYDASVRAQVKDPTLEARRRVMKEYCEWCMKELAAYRNRIEALPTEIISNNQEELSCPARS